MKSNIKEKIGDIFELPQDALRDIPKVTMYGNELVLIENHHGIRIYDEKELTVRTAVGFLKVTGEKLFISRFDESHIIVEGVITSFNVEVEDG